MSKILQWLTLILVGCALGSTTQAQDTLTTDPFNLSNSETTSGWSVAAMDAAGTLHVAWEEVSMAESHLRYRARTPDGAWGEPFTLTADFEMYLPVSARLVERADGTMCFAFAGAVRLADPSTLGLYTACGLPTTTFTRTQQIIGNQREHAVAFDASGTLQSVYTTGPGELVFASTATTISDPAFLATGARLAVDAAGTLHVAYVRMGNPYSVEHVYSTDSGLTWNGPTRLSDDALMSFNTAGPVVLATGPDGAVHAAWFSASALQYSRFVDGKWDPTATLALIVANTDMAGGGSYAFTLTFDAEGLAHIVWGGRATHYLRQLGDGRWTRPYRLDNVINTTQGPALAIDGRGIGHMVYDDSAIRNDVFYTTFDTRTLAAPAGVVGATASGRTFREVRTLVLPQVAVLSEPSVDAGYAGIINAGEPFVVVGSDPSGLWLEIELPFGGTGWVPAFLTAGENTEDGPTTVNARADQITVAVPDGALSLPGLFEAPGGALVGAAPLGEVFVAVGRTQAGDYLLVQNSAGERYWVGTATVAVQEEAADLSTLPIVWP